MARIENELRQEDFVTPLVNLRSNSVLEWPVVHVHSDGAAYEETAHGGGGVTTRMGSSCGRGGERGRRRMTMR